MGNDAMWNDISVSSHSSVQPQPTPDTENPWTCDWQWARSLVTEAVLRGTPPQEEISCPSEQRRDPWAGSNAVLPRCQTPNRGRDPVSFLETSQSLSSPPATKTDYLDTHVTDTHRCFMLLTPYIFLHTMYQPTDSLNKIQFMPIVKLLHVSAWGCHSGAETCRSLILVMTCILWLFYRVLLSALVCWCIEYTGVSQRRGFQFKTVG